MHHIKYVLDDDLPDGHDWAVVEDGSRVILFIKRSVARSPRVLADVWAGYRLLVRQRDAA